jgi:hypothetical protein
LILLAVILAGCLGKEKDFICKAKLKRLLYSGETKRAMKGVRK